MADNIIHETRSKKKQFIIFGLCSFIALALCMLTLVIVVKNVEKNENTQIQSNSEGQFLKNEKNALLNYISDITKVTLNNKSVKVNVSANVNIDDSTITVDGKTDGKDVALFTYFKNQAIEQIDALYGEDYTGEFGVIYPDMPHIALPADTKILCNMTKGLADEEGNPVYDDEGSLVDADYYFLTFTAKNGALNYEEAEAFGLKNVKSVKDGVSEILSSVCKIKSIKVTPQDFKINAKANVNTDYLEYLEYQYVYKIDADIEFVNAFSVFGEKTVSFEYAVTKRFDYSFVSVTFSEDTLHLEKGEEAQLTVNAVIEDDSEYEIKFISRNPGRVTIDEMGYVNVIEESEDPVAVTVELEYMGEKFYDECLVYTTTQENY
ncbi:MAG: hypothetical protein J6D06_10900 [Clostridia bacterium]|nr:hypothetical protein [Clostridia bacterium]